MHEPVVVHVPADVHVADSVPEGLYVLAQVMDVQE